MSSDITHVLFLSAMNSPSPYFGMAELSSQPGYDAAQKQFQMLLRSYVDQWIETGIYLDGRENLTKRGVPRRGWFKQGQLLAKAQKQYTALVMVGTLVLEVFGDAVRQTSVSPDGLEITFSTYEPKMEDAPLGVLAEREAKRFFVWFLASDLRVKLGKCRACSLYEIKTRKSYKAGTYCRRCKAKTSAGEITQKKRQELKRHRKETLTAVLKSWPERLDPNDLAMRKRVADEVNRRLRGQHKITSKWVKRNLLLVPL